MTLAWNVGDLYRSRERRRQIGLIDGLPLLKLWRESERAAPVGLWHRDVDAS
jgi:hypothetical protein